MSSDLESLILTICPHEEANKKEKTRRAKIEAWARLHGVCEIEHVELPECDYRFEGQFRGVDINLGIEYKAWDNFLSDNIDDMEDKLTRAQEPYQDVALFVETGNYSFKPDPAGVHCLLEYTEHAKAGFRLQSQKLGRIIEPPTKTLASMEGFFDTLQSNGIHVRQLRGEDHFPYALHNLLIYLTKPHQLKVKKISYDDWLINLYSNLPEVGFVRAKKLIEAYPNPFWLCSASDESLIRVLGRTTGQVVYQHLRNHELETDDWKHSCHKDGTSGNNAEPEPLRICPKCGKDTLKSTCPRCKDKADSKVGQETYIKQDFKVCNSMACQVAGNDIFPCDDPNFDKICRTPKILENHLQFHLCTTCTKHKTCDDSALETVLYAASGNVLKCKQYENKYPPKPLSPEAKKHQEFKRAKAGFQPKGSCGTCDFHITDKLICKKHPEKRAELHFKACTQYIQKKAAPLMTPGIEGHTEQDEDVSRSQKSASGSQPPDLSKSSSIEPKAQKQPAGINQENTKLKLDAHDTPKDFILKFLSFNPKGVSYGVLINALTTKYPELELYDELITSIMQEGLCYEPKIGLIVGTDISHSSTVSPKQADRNGTHDTSKSSKEVISKIPPPPLQPSEGDTSGQPGTKGSLDVLLSCQECGQGNCDEIIIHPKRLLCPKCLAIEDDDIKQQHIEISQAILEYLTGYPEGKTYQEICLKFGLKEGTQDCKDMRNCLKKMGELGLITSQSSRFKVVAPAALGAHDLNETHDLKTELTQWFLQPHTLAETVSEHAGWSKGYVFDMVMKIEEQGLIRRFAADGETKWTLAVKAQPEMDIGV